MRNLLKKFKLKIPADRQDRHEWEDRLGARILIALLLLVGIIGLLLTLGGCSNMPKYEGYWQAAHFVDVLQTIDGPANDDCYREGDPITRRLIGEKPSTGDVVLWGAGMSIAHYWVSKSLEDGPPWLYKLWQATSISISTKAIYVNHDNGIRLFDKNRSSCHEAP